MLTGTEKKEPARRKRLSAEERKNQIVEVATSLFAKKGFKGTTTREIAARAGISEAVIFRHFSKKEALYTAIINRKCGDKDGQSLLLKALEGKEGREVFREVASHLIGEQKKDPTFLRLLMYSALEEHRLSDIFFQTRGMELIGCLGEHIKGLMEAGLVRKVDPVVTARAFIGMVLHYSMSQEIYGFKRYSDITTEEAINTFITIFFEGLERRKE